MEQENKIGVELIKKAIKFFYDLGTEGVEVWKDKKISLAEAIGFSDNAFVAVQLVTKLDQIQAEFKDFGTNTNLAGHLLLEPLNCFISLNFWHHINSSCEDD